MNGKGEVIRGPKSEIRDTYGLNWFDTRKAFCSSAMNYNLDRQVFKIKTKNQECRHNLEIMAVI
jgi:hypothetical protein